MKGVLEHVKATGELPRKISQGGADIGMRLLIRRRGTDIKLTAEEKLVYKAIVNRGKLPAGRVLLLDDEEKRSRRARQSTEKKPIRAKLRSDKSKTSKNPMRY
jgi:DNA replication initiation complex subunit (GINS family)